MANSPLKWTAFDVSTGTLVWVNGADQLSTSALSTLGAVEVVNSSAYIYGMVEGRFRSTATAFAAGDYIALWWVKALDSTTYEASTAVTARPADVVFPLHTSSLVNVQLGPITLPPCPFRCVIQNKSAGQSLSTIADSNRVQLYRINTELITA
jgi:hypothetical protein